MEWLYAALEHHQLLFQLTAENNLFTVHDGLMAHWKGSANWGRIVHSTRLHEDPQVQHRNAH